MLSLADDEPLEAVDEEGEPGGGGGTYDDEEEEEMDADVECYHEIHAIPLLDPVLDKQVRGGVTSEGQAGSERDRCCSQGGGEGRSSTPQHCIRWLGDGARMHKKRGGGNNGLGSECHGSLELAPRNNFHFN